MPGSARRSTWPWLAAVCLALLAVGASGLDGAASLTPMDAPLPAVGVDPPCNRAQAVAAAPQADAQCWLLVRAASWLTPTGVRVAQGDRFRVQVPAGQFWFDAQRRSLPLTGDRGSDLMNRFASWKRVPAAPWFSLIGATAVGDGPDPAVRGATDMGAAGGVLVAAAAGELVFFANDAIAPWSDGRAFYGNNHGQIWLQLQRCRDGAAGAPANAPGTC